MTANIGFIYSLVSLIFDTKYMACDWLDFCPETGWSVEDAPCSAWINFLTPAEKAERESWDALLDIIEMTDLRMWVGAGRN